MSRKNDGMIPCDYLPERLPNRLRRVIRRTEDFGGGTDFLGGGGIFSDTVNLSPRKARLLATRPPRGLLVSGQGNGAPHGMAFFDGVLIFAQGTGLFSTADGVVVNRLGTVGDSDKQFFVFGDRLYIYPDKLYMERGGTMPKPIELDSGVIGQASFDGNTVTLPSGYAWATLGFGAGDGLRVLNADDVTPAPEGYYRIETIHGQTATLTQSFSASYVSAARFLRVVPDFARCCVSGDRVYGIAGRDVYVSGAGSATDFYSRPTGDGKHPVILHSDTEGDFTALSPWQGYVVFFKCDRICKLLGNRSDSFTLQDSMGVGIPARLANTLCEVGNLLCYCSDGGVYRYRGQQPERISPVGDGSLLRGCGGTDGQGYYLSVETSAGVRSSLYMPDREEWYPEDGADGVFLLRREGFVLIQDGEGCIWMSSSDGRTPACIFDEGQMRGPITASAQFLPDRYGEPEGYRLAGLYIRATGEAAGTLKVLAAYSDGRYSADAKGDSEVLLGEYAGEMTDRLLRVPVIPRFCDGMVLRLEMTDGWVIHAVIREYEPCGQ